MASVQELLRAGTDLPGDSAARDTEVLLCHVLSRPRAWLYTWPEAELSDSQVQIFTQLLARRREGEPVAYLTGRRDFWTLSLAVNSHTLIPRPETETLVEWALSLPLPDNASIVDLGTGTGAIALALASERPGWEVCAVDNSRQALQVAASNARAAGLDRVEFVCSHWFEQLPGRRFHLVVSNPPYIDAVDEHLQRGDVRFEPASALVAPNSGLGDLQTLAACAGNYLLPGGSILLEHGYDQAGAVRDLLLGAGFQSVASRRDLGGIERITGGVWHVE